MKKYVPYIAMLFIGAVAGLWLNRERHVDEVTIQRDTVTVYKTRYYSRPELKAKTIRLEIPKIDVRQRVFVPADSVTIIYRDSVRYVTLPRQNYFTKTEEVQIWHSGVDSTIDSLSLLFPTTTIAQTEKVARKPKKHAIGIGIEANYSTTFNMPVQLEYAYNVKPWLSVYGYAEYELFRKQFGVGAGTKVTIEY